MKWHPFIAGQEYTVSQIIEVLRKDIESVRRIVGHHSAKSKYLEEARWK
jgi:hypothetical protein